MQSPRRVALVLLAAIAFGLFAAWATGPDTDAVGTISHARAVLGNLSTPGLLVAFFAGAGCTRLRSGALVGLMATIVALAGFYLLTTLLIDLGGHGFLGDLRLELSANRGYFEGGLVTGPVFGALGAWWSQTRSLRGSLMAGGLMMAEPLVLLAIGLAFPAGVLQSSAALPTAVRMLPGWQLTTDSGASPIGIYAAEFVAGLAVVAWAARRTPRFAER